MGGCSLDSLIQSISFTGGSSAICDFLEPLGDLAKERTELSWTSEQIIDCHTEQDGDEEVEHAASAADGCCELLVTCDTGVVEIMCQWSYPLDIA